MTPAADDTPTAPRRELRAFAELFGVTGLCVAQPVLDTFADSADVFLVRRAGRVEVVAFAVAVTFVPALGLWALEAVVGAVRPGLRRAAHLALLAAVGGLFALQVAKRTTDLGSVGLFALAAAAAAVVAVVARRDAVRLFLRFLAVAPFAFLGLFLVASPVASLVWPGDGAGPGAAPTRPAPIVMIVLDELPTVSLLDGRGQIDESLFPGFAALADDATWYRNHTVVAPFTLAALPALATGDEPRAEALPVAGAYPRNLFTLLADSHELRVREPLTRLCPSRLCPYADDPPAAEVLGSLLGDAWELLDARSSPSQRDPLIGFDAHSIPVDADPMASMETFARSLGRSERPRLDFLHVMLPHQPWRYQPSGATYAAPDPPTGLTLDQRWTDQASADRTRLRHLLQLQLTDRLLGRVIDRMHELGTWDDSLVVVTADHGLSFTPGAHLRGASAENVHEVAWTPLLVKTPGQGRGEVVDRPVRSIDVVPTIADVLGMELPEEVDGTSVLDERRRRDDEVRLLDWGPSDLPTDDDGYATLDGEAGYEAVLESPRPAAGDDPDLALHRHGRYGSLVGRRLDDLDVAAPTPWLAEVNPPGARRVVDDPRRQVPVYVVGKLPGGPDVDVAVAANGVVGAVAPVYRPFGPAARIFLTFLPERLLHEGENRLGVYLVEGSQRSPRLREVPTIDLRP